MLTFSDVIAGGVVPAIVAAAVWLLVRWLRGASRRDGVPWLTGFVAGYVAAEVALRARSPQVDPLREAAGQLLRPHDAADWLPAFAIAATAIAAVLHVEKLGKGRIVAWLAAAAVACALPWRLLAGSRYLPSQELRDAGFADDAWSLPTATAVMAGVGAAVWLTWFAWSAGKSGEQPWLRSVLAVAAAVAAAALAGLSGSFSYALSIGAVAASLGGCAAAAWFARPSLGPCDAGGAATVVVSGMLVCSVAFSEAALWRAAVVAGAWFVAAGRLPRIDRLSHGAAAVLRATMCIVLIVVAVGAAAYDFSAAIEAQPEAPAESASPYDALR